MRDLCGRDDRFYDGRQMTSRMDEIQAAVLRVKLRHLPEWLQQRQELGAKYRERLGPLGLTLPGSSLEHLFCIRHGRRDELIAFYERRGYARTGIKKPFPYGDERYGIPKRADLRFEILEKPLTGAAA